MWLYPHAVQRAKKFYLVKSIAVQSAAIMAHAKKCVVLFL